jgi:hypothetical protein
MNKEYITTCTHTQVFDQEHFRSEYQETILAKTVVIDVKPNKNVTNTGAWFDSSPHGYTFKIKGGDGREKWVYYDWFLVPNTTKNVAIIDEILNVRDEIKQHEAKIKKLSNSYEH